jgi:inosine-uridine nucleoside N-ribohydrolase
MRIAKHLTPLCVVVLLCAGWAHAAPAAEPKIPVVLSTDVGNEVDDQWTVVYTLTNPRLDVLGVMSAHAPSLSPPAGRTSYRILLDVVESRLGMAQHPPLLEGASLPLQDTKTPRQSPAARFLVETSKPFSESNRLTVLMIGAATDVASAILLDPSIVRRIRVVQMGFNDWPTGGDEFNIANDVKAVQVVLDSDVPLTVGSGRVCRESLSLGLDQARELVGGHGPVGAWLWEEFQAWYYRFVKPLRKDDFSKPWIIWDNIVLAHVLGMTTQETYPRPRLKDDMTFERVQTDRTITWITDVDEKRMWADFLEKLDTYQRTHAVGRDACGTRLSFMSP